MKNAAFLLLALSIAAIPASARECGLRVRDAWVRLPPGGASMLAGYGRIENPCRKPLAVTGIRTAAFGSASLHETRMESGVSRMRAVPRLEVPAGGSVTLAPGGRHLMLMMPTAPLKAGQQVDIGFELESGAEAKARFDVRAIGG